MGKCLPKPPECPPGEEPGPNDPLTCLPQCEYHPPVGDFTPVVKYAWGMANSPNDQHDVMMTPIVIQLDDDTCDGVVDERDIPEIVFLSFKDGAYGTNGTLHAISIVGGTVLAIGVAMIVLPGPALVVIPLGLAILGAEYAWARRWLRKVKARTSMIVARVRNTTTRKPDAAPATGAVGPAAAASRPEDPPR